MSEPAEIPARLPRVHPGAFIAPGAVVVGDVAIGEGSGVWFQTVVRGDSDRIEIGRRSNVQDLSIVHVDFGCPTIVGDDVTIGHRAIVHGCVIEDRCLIGMGAIVMDGVEIGDDCLVAAGALVTPGTKIPSGHLVLGRPAAVTRPLRPDELAYLRQSAANYVEHASGYRRQC